MYGLMMEDIEKTERSKPGSMDLFKKAIEESR